MFTVPFHFPFHCSNPYSSPAIRDTPRILYIIEKDFILQSKSAHFETATLCVAKLFFVFLAALDTSNLLSMPMYWWWGQSSRNFGHMLSVGIIRFEDRLCASKKGGIGLSDKVPCTWQLRIGSFLFFLAQTSWGICWLESSDNWKFASEWRWSRLWTQENWQKNLWVKSLVLAPNRNGF